MIRPLTNLIKDIIKQQSSQVDAIGNLQGSPLVFEDAKNVISAQGTWKLYELNSLRPYSPGELISKIFSIQSRVAPIVTSTDGILNVVAKDGTTLVSTTVNISQALGFTIQIFCPNKQIALYIGESLVRGGTNSLITTINLPIGKTPINVITYGSSTSNLTVQIPNDIVVSVGNFVPPVPRLIDSGALNSAYVDPKTGSTGISISWYNQENVGGWGVYSVQSGSFGIAGNILATGGKYIITTNYSGIAPFDSSVVTINGITLGTIESSNYDDSTMSLSVTVNAFQQGNIDFTTIHSGALSVLTFQHLQNIIRASQGNVVTFVDLNVRTGLRYIYCLDSFAPGDVNVRSEKSPFITITAGDIFAPGSITLLSVIADDNKRLAVSYITPVDEDYYATKAIYYYQGSGAGPVVNTNYITDTGFPNTQDSMIIAGITSGTFYFVTSDILGNTQYILSGVPYYWTGSGTAAAGGVVTNTAPTISIAQLSAEEMTSNSRTFAQFRLSATDAETPGAVTIQYKINSGTSDPWITAPTNPFIITFGVLNRDGWVLARAFDGILFSNELMGSADFDTTPEISSAYSRYIVSSGNMFVTGTVDDDTKSIKWYIDNGAETGDPIISSPTIIDNLIVNKTFNFNFTISDGQRKIFKIDPYPLLGGLGNIGNSYREEVIRLPKTSSSIKDRSLGGTVTKTDAQVTLSSSPALPLGVTFDRVKPIVNGSVMSGTANSIMDTTKNFTTNQYATYWDVEIVSGKGLGQRRNIVSGSAMILSVSPSFATIPDTTSKYYVAETYRHYSDSGKVTSATNNSITDSTKAWISNEFIGKELNIYSGTGTGQLALIASGTATTVYLTTFLTPTPDSTSGYIINGPLNIARNITEDVTVDYYSFVPTNGLTEEARSLSIDDDTIPSIKSGSLIEITPNVVTVSIYSPDDDTKYWSLWVRRNNWPTINSGSSTASLDNDYLRFSAADITVTSITFAANNGFWYGIILPYDSYANPGNRVIFSGNVTGSASITPNILSLQIDSSSWVEGNTGITGHKVWWTHNSVAEKPAGNGTATVRIWRKRPNDADYIEKTSDTRYSWQDSEDNDYKLNDDDTLNTLLGRGSFMVTFINTIFSFVHGLWSYRVDLYNNGVYVNSYFASIQV